MFDKLKLKSAGRNLVPAAAPVAADETPGHRAIYQNRRNFGVNLGSCFVLEKYMFGDLFIDDSKAELDCVERQVKENGVDQTREALEEHWKSFMTDDDWNYLRDKRVNSVRLPVGYWELGRDFSKGTPFEKVAAVYTNAWAIIKSLIEAAAKYDISVLIDLHALPGGANKGDHSGQILRTPGFWSSSTYKTVAVECCGFLAKETKKYDHISGIQIVNEAEYSHDGKDQKLYYAAAINAIRTVNADVPIVISDGWSPQPWAEWLHDMGSPLGVVLDCHVYRCFSDEDKKKTPEQITADLERDCLTLETKADIVVGEYSCVIDGQSWDRTQGNREELCHSYGNQQHRWFQERADVGSYFWSYKFQYGDGGEWGFRPMVERGCLPQPGEAKLPSDDDFGRTLDQHYGDHREYWDKQNSKEKYEHERYKAGFTTAWNDALAFAQFNSSRLGRVVAWMQFRRIQHVHASGDGKFVWEWEQGFEQGLKAFNEAAF
ncbi:glycoside hydrolase family 5 protein [Babjeviella inositovora NRRL Y-12698]|uniref:Glycoside hydrolase family 5 protein n=1 Tax=Babjeviella inositovora NRRL Y-12698 TaxID=984486 RepID=A0A1E3R117_9ASCO|nr:glycoside hydrolase family 5 protein [Babjeviella inositovora NRRL Y-12698]ODQ83077.1 glycoside hydrolase family 5 protein [Babjeviella inositovora NRRL Y-12698]